MSPAFPLGASSEWQSLSGRERGQRPRVGCVACCNGLTCTLRPSCLSPLHCIAWPQVSMHIWDTAGQEEFSKLTRNYYKGAQACVLAFSTTDRDSFNAVPKWMEQAKATIPDDIAWALVQNKCDLMQGGEAETTPEEAEALATKLGVRFYRMSVKENMMVDDVFTYLAETAYEIIKRPPAAGAPAPAPAAAPAAAAAAAGADAGAAAAAAAGPVEPATVQLGGPSKQRTGGKKSGCC